MEALLSRVDAQIRECRLPWVRNGNAVRVELTRHGRRHTVHLARKGDRYLFRAVVAGAALIGGNDARRRELAYRIWRRNALKSVILFTIDGRDRVIGLVEQPVASMHDAELRSYVETLAKECDRFEYVLTGEDSR